MVKREITGDDAALQEKIEKLRDALKSLKEKMSELRKAGKDTKIAEIMCMSIKPKIDYAEISGEGKDIEAAERLLSEVEDELSRVK